MIIEIFKTKYKFSFSFFAVVTVMLLTADSGIALLSLVSSLLHECGHLVFMYLFGENPDSVELGAFGIRIERLAVSDLSYGKEAVIAISGVAVNFLLCAVFLLIYCFNGKSLMLAVVFVNLFIAALNLMPVGMLDAGRFLRYILYMRTDDRKTEIILSRISNITVILFCIFTALYTVLAGINISLIAVSIYLILSNLKRR